MIDMGVSPRDTMFEEMKTVATMVEADKLHRFVKSNVTNRMTDCVRNIARCIHFCKKRESTHRI